MESKEGAQLAAGQLAAAALRQGGVQRQSADPHTAQGGHLCAVLVEHPPHLMIDSLINGDPGAQRRERLEQSRGGTLAAAEIEAIKYSHMARLDALVAQMRTEFEAQPEGKYRSLMVYAYTNCDRFYDLEEDCENDMQKVIEEIRAFQRKAGQPEDLADRVWNAYKSEKTYLLSYYCVKLR